MKRRHHFALLGLSAILLSACAAEELLSDSQEPIAASSQAAVITRLIPIRFIHTSSCAQGPTCFGEETFAHLQASVDRLNEVFEAAGVKFWIKSNEIYNVPTFRVLDTETEETFSDVKGELRLMFPNMPSNAYYAADSNERADWLGSVTPFYGDPDVVHVFLHGGGDLSFGAFPERGRSVHIVAANLHHEANDVATAHLAHEMGHFFGPRHTFVSLAGVNPETGQGWTQADRWDLLYCDTDPPKFWSSKAAFLADSCASLRVIDRDADCHAEPAPYGPLTCTITTSSNTEYTYSAGSPELAGLASSDPAVVHDPPSTFKYGANVMGYRRGDRWNMDARPRAFFSGSQLAMIDKNLDFDMDYYAESQANHARGDGTVPLGGLGSLGHSSLRTLLGTATEDFVYWANGPHANAIFSFHAKDEPVTGLLLEPVRGDFDEDGHDDVYWHDPGSLTGTFWWGRSDRGFDKVSTAGFAPGVGYKALAGDFNGDTLDDLFFYKAGSDPEYIYLSTGTRAFNGSLGPQAVSGTYRPIVGNFDGTSGDDIFWYNQSNGLINRWYSTSTSTFAVHLDYPVDSGGPFEPIVGNFDGEAGDDIFWYKAGSGADRLWYSHSIGSLDFVKVNGKTVSGTYVPVAGDFDGDLRTDIYWDVPNNTMDYIWAGVASHTTQFETRRASVVGSFRPVSGDFDGDGRADIFWYRP